MPTKKPSRSFPRKTTYSKKQKLKPDQKDTTSSPLESHDHEQKLSFPSENSLLDSMTEISENSGSKHPLHSSSTSKDELSFNSDLGDEFLTQQDLLNKRVRRYNVAVPQLSVAKIVEFHLRGIPLSRGDEILQKKALSSDEVILENKDFDSKIAKIFPLGVAVHNGKLLSICPFAKKVLSGAKPIEPPLVDSFFRETFHNGSWYMKNRKAYFVLSHLETDSTLSDYNSDSDLSDTEDAALDKRGLIFRPSKAVQIEPFTIDKSKSNFSQQDSKVFRTLTKLSLENINKLTSLGFDPSNPSNLGRYDQVFKKQKQSSLLAVSQPTNITNLNNEGKMEAARLPIRTLIDPQGYLSQISLQLPKNFENFQKRGNRYLSHIQLQTNSHIFARLVEIFKLYAKIFDPIEDSFKNYCIAEASETNTYILSMLKYCNSIFRDLLLAHAQNLEACKIKNKKTQTEHVYKILETLHNKLPIEACTLGDLGNSSLFEKRTFSGLAPIESFKSRRFNFSRNRKFSRGRKRKRTDDNKKRDNQTQRPRKRQKNFPKEKQQSKQPFSTPKKKVKPHN